jgi:hypothetical protein
MSSVTVPCGTPTVVTTNDAWQAYLAEPAAITLPVSDAGNTSTMMGYLIYGDQNYQPSENPNVLAQSQTLRSWNGEYALSIDTTGRLGISSTSPSGQSIWTGQGLTTVPPVFTPGPLHWAR